MSKEVDLSIIIVSLNTKNVLANCLDSVKSAISEVNAEVIVVDSSSTDGSADMVENKYPWVILIKKHKIRGFGENNNFGIKIARGRYILLLNSDTVVINKNIFSEMIEYLDQNPKIGLASCALLNSDGVSYQGSGGYFPTLLRVFLWMSFLDDIPFMDRLVKPYHPLHGWSPIFKNEGYFHEKHRQDWVTGAYFLTRKSILKEVGLFDEDFFLYVEEVDLSFRIQQKGWETWYLPKWKIIHLGQASVGSENSVIYEFKNLILFYKKHYSSWKLPLLRVILKFGIILRFCIFGILKGVKVAKVYAKAFSSI